MLYYILKDGGLTTGGVNFDAKVRREKLEPVDLFYAHIGGMDAFARGLLAARDDRRRRARAGEGALRQLGEHRVQSMQRKRIRARQRARREEKASNRQQRSGRQERLENVLNRYV